MIKAFITAALLLTAGIAGLSAGTGCNAIDAAFDCNAICSRYHDCFDSNYDVSACADRCRDNADADQDFGDKASACEACIDDRSCTESFGCVGECNGVVP